MHSTSLLLAALSLTALGLSPTLAPRAQDAAPFTVAAPDKPLADMELVEDQSEAVANEFLGFADKIRRRDFAGASAWITTDFRGHAWDALTVKEEKALPLDSTRTAYDPKSARVVDGAGYLASLASWIAPWQRVEFVLYKVKAADFQTGLPVWGKIRFQVTILGTAEDGGPRSIVAWAPARVLRDQGKWKLAALELEALQVDRRGDYLFTNVATSAGVAATSVRFGVEGNKSFAWNGVAAGDADGDGLVDLFVPARPKNRLYMARGASGFEELAEAAGIAQPAGGTGALFFDYDGDGDQDLACGDVGWVEADGRTGGNPLRIWRNDSERGGRVRFTEVAQSLGCDVRSNAYTLVTFDAENDGWLDLFVCNYGRLESARNDSWTDAKNGMPDQLWHNEGGKRFVEVAKARGLGDTRWGYAAAAADYDADGDQDLYVANDYAINFLWQNQGDGSFVEVAAKAGIDDLGNGMGCSWGDLNADGRLDLYVANMASTAGNRILKRLTNQAGSWKDLSKMAGGNSIFLAKADGTFERLPSDKGGIGASWAWGPALVDLDLDGLTDIFCANGFITGNTAADT
jgi:hypothetical protein